MGLFDIFTGDAYKEAADKQRQFYDQLRGQTQGQVAGAQSQGIGALKSGQAGALDSISAGTAGGTDAISSNLAAALAALRGGTDSAASALNAGQAGGLASLAPIAAAGAQYGKFGTGAGNASADALGLNGPEGIARAQSSFQATPGFTFGLNQGLESILRNANASGMAASGNQLRESQTFGQGLGNQEFQKYLSNLSGMSQLYSPLENQALSTAGTGAANIYTGTASKLSDLLSGSGSKAAGLYTGAGQSIADLLSGGGRAAAGVQTSTGQSIADLIKSLTQTGVSSNTALAPGYAGTYGTEAAAETGGSANLWNLLGSGAKFASGGGLSSLTSLLGK